MIRTLARSGVSLGAALAIALVGTSVAYAADDLVADGDGAVPVSASALAFGTVCRNAPASRTVAFAVKNGSGQTFANGATVSLTAFSLPAGVTAGSFGSIALPAGWNALAAGTLSNATTGVVTIDTSAVKTYTGTVSFRATGDKDGGGTLSAETTTQVSGSVVACDSTPPVLTLPGPLTVEAAGPGGAVATFTATATDAADGVRPVTCTPASGATFPLGTTTVECAASDTSGNTATGSFTVTVSDTTGPVLSLPPSQTVEATGASGAVVTFTATATDAVDGSVPVGCTPAPGGTFPLGTTTVACSATDTRDNTSAGSFGVTVRDTTAPALTLPTGVDAEATSASGAVVTYAASAGDLVDALPDFSCDRASGSTFPLGATLVTCSAADDSGNAAQGTFTVNVGDTTGPAVNGPGDLTVEATGPAGATVPFTVTAHDAVDGDLTPVCAPASGSGFAIGTTAVSCSATDTAGNAGGTSFDVTVADSTPPALSLPGDLVVEATSPSGAEVAYAVSATDVVAGAVTVDCDVPAGSFPLGTTTVACSATDGYGNLSAGTFTVTVADTTDPVLTLPGDLVVEATGADGAGVTFTAYGTDVVSGTVPAVCSPVSGDVFALGHTEVSCTATDGAGNDVTGTFDVHVRDTTDPDLHVPGGVVEEATSAAGAAVSYAATADDVVDAAVTVGCTPASGQTFPLGTTQVSCTATDDAGNDVTKTFDVVVQDTTEPQVAVPADQVVEATGPAGAAYEYAASATDAVSTVSPDCAPASGATFPLGTTTVTCTATDDAGNTGDASFAVTVVDTTAPALTLPANQVVEATGPGGAVATFAATAHDLVDGARTPTCTPSSGSVFALGETTVSCSVSDTTGNATGGAFTVTVVDTTPPVLALPDNVVEEATGPGGNAVTYAATATDAVSGSVPVDCTPASGATFAITTTPVSCSATDGAANTAVGGFTVTVRDTAAPDVTVPGNATVEATGPGGAVHTFAASAHDVVDGDLAPTCAPASGATFPLGVTPVLCAATDAHDNTGSGGFTVSVVDTTAPVVTVPADRTVEATGPAGATTTFAASAADAVDGTPAVTCDPASGATFPLGTTTVTCTATDAAGNTGVASFHVTVVDTTAPAVTVPATKTVEATGAAGAVVTFTTSATDAVAGAPTPSCNPASGATFGLGTTTVACTATDLAGNIGQASFDVVVVDTTKPVLTLPAGLAVLATDANGAAVTFATNATDTVAGSVAVVCTPASGAAFPVGATLVGCSATDGAGNTAVGSFSVAVGYAFSGFLQPVNDTAHQTGVQQSRFKLGSTVPLKFRLGTLGSPSVQQAAMPLFAKAYRGAACDSTTVTEPPADATSTTGTTYRWDATAQQYVYNFSTKGLAAGEWRVWALTADGAANYVDVCLTR